MQEQLKQLYQELQVDAYRLKSVLAVFQKLVSSSFVTKMLGHLQLLFTEEFQDVASRLRKLKAVRTRQELSDQLLLNSEIFKNNLQVITTHVKGVPEVPATQSPEDKRLRAGAEAGGGQPSPAGPAQARQSEAPGRPQGAGRGQEGGAEKREGEVEAEKSVEGRQVILFMILLIAQAWCIPQQGPVIGIFTMDSDFDGPDSALDGYTYVASSYVKWVEMAGAQAVPVRSYSTKEELRLIFSKVNGLLFPGGEMPIDIHNTWVQNFEFLLQLAVEENRKGSPFPVWTTCLGYQVLAYLFNGYQFPLVLLTDESAIVRPMKIQKLDSVIFRSMSAGLLNRIENGTGLYYFNHRYCILTEDFLSYPVLSSQFDLLGNSTNIKGVNFVSMIQHKQFPIFGVQFHPEKNNFEFRVDANRTAAGVAASLAMANVFVDFARQNSHSFDSLEQLTASLFYNTRLTSHSPEEDPFQAQYFFKENIKVI